MNLTLKVTKKESTNMSKFIKIMCSLNCRINVDSLNGNISIQDMDDEYVESVIDIISEAFDIAGVDIVPTEGATKPKPQMINKTDNTKDLVEFEKFDLNDEEVRNQINKLLRNISFVMNSENAESYDICKYLMTTNCEIAMKYRPDDLVKISVGDIVDCNYVNHLDGEISGGHVHSIVCDIDDEGLAYALPISKRVISDDYARYIPFKAEQDVFYNDSKYTGGSILINKGRYIHTQRVFEVVGHVLPEFFIEVLKALSNSFDFTSNVVDYKENNEEDEVESTETSCENAQDSDANNEVKKVSAEEYIESIISDAFDFENKYDLNQIIPKFMEDTGIGGHNRVLKYAFIGACIVDKINYENIILYVKQSISDLEEDDIKLTLKDEFNKWLAIHPDVKEKYPKVSIMTMLKIFAKRMKP